MVNVEMHVDEDRNGTVGFYQHGDNEVINEAKYNFWLNNDFDWMHYEEGEWHEDDKDNSGTGRKNFADIYVGNKDGVDANSACKRDLEDFAMLQLRVPAWLKDMQGVVYSLKFKNVGSPAINLFEAVNELGDYQKTDFVADMQILKTRLNPQSISNDYEYEIPRELVDKDGAIAPFIFEGVSQGTGELVLAVKINDAVVAETSVELELHDIKWFYDEYTTGLESGTGDRWEARVKPLYNHDNAAAYQPKTNEYLLFIHGWNVTKDEKQRWAETIFKRLWWQGYHGGVGIFNWPCLNWYWLTGLVLDPRNFDNSEFLSWQSGESLSKLLFNLKSSGKKLAVLAHSQGNVAMSEALRKYSGPLVDAYIASQAAVSAGSYSSAGFTAATTWWLIGDLKTPDMYGRDYSLAGVNGPYFRDNRLKVSKMVNYYNEKDYALSGLAGWDGNNAMKPDYRFNYQGDMLEYDEGVDRFTRDSGTVADLAVINESERFQIFSYIAESRTRPLGMQKIDEGNVTSFNIRDGLYGFDDKHYSHSRQFRSNILNEWRYWRSIMLNSGFDSSIKE